MATFVGGPRRSTHEAAGTGAAFEVEIIEAFPEWPTTPPTMLERAIVLNHQERHLEALQLLFDHEAHAAFARITTASGSRVEHMDGATREP